MNPTSQQNKPTTNPRIKSFLESLRQRSAGSPFEKTNLPTPDFQEQRNKEAQRKQEFHRSRTQEFNQVYSATKRQENQRVQEIIAELKTLAKSMRKLKKEVRVAITTEKDSTQASKYQTSFLQHIRLMVKLLNRQVESANTWLQISNSRRQKKGFYWTQAKKKGTKFTLSEERQVATSIG